MKGVLILMRCLKKPDWRDRVFVVQNPNFTQPDGLRLARIALQCISAHRGTLQKSLMTVLLFPDFQI